MLAVEDVLESVADCMAYNQSTEDVGKKDGKSGARVVFKVTTCQHAASSKQETR